MSITRITRNAVMGLVAAALALLMTASGSTPARHAGFMGWSEPDEVGATTTTTAITSLFRFSSVVGGKAVRWNPCAPIHWKFRTTGAPSGALTMVRQAVARVAQVTSTHWVEDASTTAVPNSAWLPKTTDDIKPVLIGWTDAAHSDLLAGRAASVLGVTRTAYFGTTLNGASIAATKAAVIALDRTDRLPLTGALSWKTTLLHELGHAMGLDHVGYSSQLMYPSLSRSLTDYQVGDKAGLWRLGRAFGCVNLGF